MQRYVGCTARCNMYIDIFYSIDYKMEIEDLRSYINRRALHSNNKSDVVYEAWLIDKENETIVTDWLIQHDISFLVRQTKQQLLDASLDYNWE